MLPLRDDVPKKSFPAVNWAIIAGNAAVFFHELSLGGRLEAFLLRWGLVPAHFASVALRHRLGPALWAAPLLTSMFLHGGWFHIIANMWMLYLFGSSVEDRLGHGRYALFYLLAGLAAGGTQVWASWGSKVPTIGASGAIAGVMGAYLILYPGARVLTLVPIFFFLRLIEIPASLFLLFWLWTQLYAGRMALRQAAPVGGVAWWAHIGGFAAGIVLLGLFLPRRARRAARG